MSPGKLVRRLLGPRLFQPLGDAYRALFVSLEQVAKSFPTLAAGTHVLDVGGGDGQIVNELLRLYPDIRVTIIDIAAELGGALAPENRPRVTVLPRTSIHDYLALRLPAPDLVSVCDVVHHVPTAQRAQFFAEIANLLRPETPLFVKDIRPGGYRATLACLADRYVTGDRHVTLASEEEMEHLVQSAMPDRTPQRTELFSRDAPNYAIVFRSNRAA